MPANKKIMRIHSLLKEKLQDPCERKLTKNALKAAYDSDKTRKYVTSRGLDDLNPNYRYEFYTSRARFQIDIKKIISTKLNKKKEINVLDAGAGQGNFLSDLKQNFGKRINTHALTLGKFKELEFNKKAGLIDEITNIAIENFIPKKEYDFIFSYFGAVDYTEHPDIAIAKLAYSLAPEGIAFLVGEETISDFSLDLKIHLIKEDPMFVIKRIDSGLMIYRKAAKSKKK